MEEWLGRRYRHRERETEAGGYLMEESDKEGDTEKERQKLEDILWKSDKEGATDTKKERQKQEDI